MCGQSLVPCLDGVAARRRLTSTPPAIPRCHNPRPRAWTARSSSSRLMRAVPPYHRQMGNRLKAKVRAQNTDRKRLTYVAKQLNFDSEKCVPILMRRGSRCKKCFRKNASFEKMLHATKNALWDSQCSKTHGKVTTLEKCFMQKK